MNKRFSKNVTPIKPIKKKDNEIIKKEIIKRISLDSHNESKCSESLEEIKDQNKTLETEQIKPEKYSEAKQSFLYESESPSSTNHIDKTNKNCSVTLVSKLESDWDKSSNDSSISCLNNSTNI